MPEKVAFATKLQIAGALISTALDAGVPCAWVLADALCGSDSRLRQLLEDCRQPYVLAVRSNLHLRFVTRDGFLRTDPATLADELAANAWKTHAAGEGTKGIRLYDWASVRLRNLPGGFGDETSFSDVSWTGLAVWSGVGEPWSYIEPSRAGAFQALKPITVLNYNQTHWTIAKPTGPQQCSATLQLESFPTAWQLLFAVLGGNVVVAGILFAAIRLFSHH